MKNRELMLFNSKWGAVIKELPIWDCHTHLGRDADRSSITLRSLIRELNQFYIDKAVVFPLNTIREKRSFHNSNSLVHSAWKKYPARIVPFMRLHPLQDWKSEFRLRVGQGFRGIKLHPRAQNFEIAGKQAMSIYAQATDAGIPVLVHTGLGLEALVPGLRRITKEHPRLVFILGHSGISDLENLLAFVKKEKPRNLYFDTSVVPMYDLYEVLDNISSERILYGSDTPYGDIEIMLESLLDMAFAVGLKVNDVQQILHGNLERLIP